MVQFISIQDIKDLSVIDFSIDDKYLIPNITKCQDFILKPLLGVKYKELETQISNNNLSEDNKTLLEDYIHPVIVYYVMSEVVYSTAYKLKNLGIDDGAQYRFEELIKISKKYLIDSEHYQQILKEFMCDNNVPIDIEYKEPSCGLYLGRRRYDISRDK